MWKSQATDDKLSGHVTHYKILGASIISPTKGALLWSRDCFKILPFVVMQRVTTVCQRQLSYLSSVELSRIGRSEPSQPDSTQVEMFRNVEN